MHTILGINGSTGKLLAEQLVKQNIAVRGVSRRPFPGNWEHVAADVMDAENLRKAVEGSEVVYLLIGLEYNTKVWQRDWVKVMQNTIDACAATGAKLVFIDNVYMYGWVQGVMTEQTPMNPTSEKGKVRRDVAQLLLTAMKSNILRGCIARSADFYGPDCSLSMITQTVFQNLAKGKTAQWLGNPDVVHSFTFTPDIAKALYILGTDIRADNQIWHLPTAANPLTGREIVEKVADYMGKKNKLMSMGQFMLSILGIFIPVLKEMKEMMYQFDNDYVFSSEKFENMFNMLPTSYEEGLKQTAAYYLNQEEKHQ